MSWNTPQQLESYIGLTFEDFAGGENRFQTALDEANAEILFRLGTFDENSYVEREPFATTKFNAAQVLAKRAEWQKAGSILYYQKAEHENQFGEAGNIEGTPDGMIRGAFTPNRLEVATNYRQRAQELNGQYENIMAMIEPRTNLPVLAVNSGRTDFTDNGTYFGKDEWT